jgi:hypothetical protein
MPLGALSICQVSNQLSGKLVNVHASEVIDLLSLEIEDGPAKDDRYVDATAVEYFSVHDLPPIEGPCGKGCACWAAIARQIALGLFPLRLWPRPPHLRDAVSNSFHRTLEVRGNKHPRFTGLDEIEQSPILLGCPICSAVLHSHQNTVSSVHRPGCTMARVFLRPVTGLFDEALSERAAQMAATFIQVSNVLAMSVGLVQPRFDVF